VHNYHWIFLIDGILTLICGGAFLLLCPNQAESAWFLNERERKVAVERLRGNQSSLSSKTWKWGQFGEAFAVWKDPQGILRESSRTLLSNWTRG
jgi:ACS family allantoate permease-like MFS transporter